MHKYIIILLLIPVILPASGEQLFTADTIYVTATRSPSEYHTNFRMISVINPNDVQAGMVNTIDEILYTSGLLDMQARQINVQTDLSMRGSSFEQVLVLIDGCPINLSLIHI